MKKSKKKVRNPDGFLLKEEGITVGELRQFLSKLPSDIIIQVSEYNGDTLYECNITEAIYASNVKEVSFLSNMTREIIQSKNINELICPKN